MRTNSIGSRCPTFKTEIFEETGLDQEMSGHPVLDPKKFGATSIIQVAMLKKIFNEEELDEWYTD